ncbi:MAG: DUF4367 domain-containing protein [Anaerolineae bacterium]|nr:DUF4367 domain-containing protein [Anaerolineae bacterium]
MSELERELFEKQLLTIAKGLDYPRTPDIAGSVMTRLRASTRPRFITRKLAWSLTIILILFSSLMLIPPARAAIIEFIQIGIVRIFPRPTEPPIDAIQTATPESIVPTTATPSLPSATLIPSLSRIAGKTTLADAQQKVNYSILLPAYPPDLGQPDYVFLQDAEGAMTILVWLDPRQPDRVLMSLHFIPAGSWAIDKSEPAVIEETNVNGQRAIWAVGPYPLRLSNGDLDFTRLIDGNVLIWADGNITYRLETNQPLEEAIKITESLKSIP